MEKAPKSFLNLVDSGALWLAIRFDRASLDFFCNSKLVLRLARSVAQTLVALTIVRRMRGIEYDGTIRWRIHSWLFSKKHRSWYLV